MIRWFMDWWASRCRDIDVEVLWPTCKRLAAEQGRDIEAGRAFAHHAAEDWAWKRLPYDEVCRQIEELT